MTKKGENFSHSGYLTVLLHGHLQTETDLFLNIDSDAMTYLYPEVIERMGFTGLIPQRVKINYTLYCKMVPRCLPL
jgi:hypothetical protein